MNFLERSTPCITPCSIHSYYKTPANLELTHYDKSHPFQMYMLASKVHNKGLQGRNSLSKHVLYLEVPLCCGNYTERLCPMRDDNIHQKWDSCMEWKSCPLKDTMHCRGAKCCLLLHCWHRERKWQLCGHHRAWHTILTTPALLLSLLLHVKATHVQSTLCAVQKTHRAQTPRCHQSILRAVSAIGSELPCTWPRITTHIACHAEWEQQ